MSALSSATRTRTRGRRAPRSPAGGGAERVDADRPRRAASAAPPRRSDRPPARGGRARGRGGRSDRPAGAPWPRGIVTVKRAAAARLRSRPASSPPCSGTSSWTSARPMPEPSCVRARTPSTRWKRSKSAASSLGGDADAGVAHDQRDRRAAVGELDRDPALERELERVGEEVEDDLLPHVAIDVDRLEAGRRSRRRSVSPARSIAERKTLARSAVKAARSVGSYARLVPARLDPREVEQRVDELEQAQAVAVDDRRACRGRSGSTAAGARASRSSSGPSISVSGVRNSWLTLLKNVVLARSSSASASARLRSSS